MRTRGVETPIKIIRVCLRSVNSRDFGLLPHILPIPERYPRRAQNEVVHFQKTVAGNFSSARAAKAKTNLPVWNQG